MIAVQRGTPLILTSAAATLAFQAGAINMGIAGQFMVGSAFAAIAGYALAGLPKLLHILLVLLICAIAGAVAGFIPAFFKRISGINEVVTGMIANLLMPQLLNMVISAVPVLREAQHGSSRGIPTSAQFRQFVELTNGRLGTGTKANTSIFLAVIVVLFLAWWMKHSKLGFELRMTKANYFFAEFAGIRASRSFY
ncbi:MAG: ABC transporter permease, partial [Chloroflexi bacterium]|nr:ABC transporter permease [Chloroflexota bacterium]